MKKEKNHLRVLAETVLRKVRERRANMQNPPLPKRKATKKMKGTDVSSILLDAIDRIDSMTEEELDHIEKIASDVIHSTAKAETKKRKRSESGMTDAQDIVQNSLDKAKAPTTFVYGFDSGLRLMYRDEFRAIPEESPIPELTGILSAALIRSATHIAVVHVTDSPEAFGKNKYEWIAFAKDLKEEGENLDFHLLRTMIALKKSKISEARLSTELRESGHFLVLVR